MDPYSYAAALADLFDQHAHELAEKLRALCVCDFRSDPPSDYCRCVMTPDEAASLIDPKMSPEVKK